MIEIPSKIGSPIRHDNVPPMLPGPRARTVSTENDPPSTLGSTLGAVMVIYRLSATH